MANNDIAQFEREFKNAVKDIENETQKVAKEVIWQTLKEITPIAEKKMKEIVWKNFYSQVPESDFYDRTYQLLNAFTIKPTHGGGYYTMSVYYNPDRLITKKPNGSKKLWSYGYSYGKSLVGTPLDLGEKQELLEWFDLPEDKRKGNIGTATTHYNFTGNFTGAFQKWFDEEYGKLFEKNFNVRIRRIKFHNG